MLGLVTDRLGEQDDKEGAMALLTNLRGVFAAIAETKALLALISTCVPRMAKERADLLSKADDINQDLDDPYYGSDQDFLENQPLDMESEKIQRFLSSQALRLADMMKLLESRGKILEDLSQGDIREMSEALLAAHEVATQIQGDARQLRKKSVDLDTMRAHIRPRLGQTQALSVTKQSMKQGIKVWTDVDAAMFKSIITPPKRSTFLLKRTERKTQVIRATPKSRQTVPKASSSLLIGQTRSHQKSSIEKSPFSPPLQLQSRVAWEEKASTIDQEKARQVVFSSPQELKQTSIEAESKEVLKGYGTTVERVHGIATERIVKKAAPLPPSSRKGDTSQAISATPQSTETKQSDRSTRLKPSPEPKQDREESSLGMFSTTAKRSSTTQAGNSGSSDKSTGIKNSFDGMSGLGLSFASGSDKNLMSMNEPKGPEPSLFDSSSKPADKSRQPSSPHDYNAMLTQFYEKHNPSKLNTVAATVKKYQGREKEMFAKLAKKYNVESPLEKATEPKSDSGGPTKQSGTAMGSSPFQQTPNQSSALTPTAKPPLAPSPFAAGGQTNIAPTFALPAPSGNSPFGTPAPAGGTPAFGQGGNSPFSTTAAPAQSPFSQAPTTTAPVSVPSTGQSQFAGKSPREMLMAFYQQKNPSKLTEVDKVLAKYIGKEEQLFRNLAKKYNLDPTVFGLQAAVGNSPGFVPSAQPQAAGGFGGGSVGFGQPSVLGGGPAFASPSPFGSPPAAASGFGFSSPPTPSPAFGSGFGGGAPSSFGSLAGGSPSTFGSIAQGASPAPTFGSMAPATTNSFGQTAPASFGAPFGNPRR